MLPGLETPIIPLKNTEGFKEGKRKQEVKRNSQEHEAVVRVQMEKIQNGPKKNKRFFWRGWGASAAVSRKSQCW